MSDATDPTPNLPATTKRPVPVKAWQQYLEGMGDDLTPEALADHLGDGEGLDNAARFVAFAERHASTVRQAVGLGLTRVRDGFGRGEWTPWLDGFAQRNGCSMRSISRWMMEVQREQAIDPPKGAKVGRRSAATTPSSSSPVANIPVDNPIEATAVETPKANVATSTLPADPPAPPPPPRPAPQAPPPPPLSPSPADDGFDEWAAGFIMASPIELDRWCKANRGKAGALETAVHASLARTGKSVPTDDRPAVNAIKPTRRAGTVRRPVAPVEPGGPCAHPGDQIRNVGYGNVCDVCHTLVR